MWVYIKWLKEKIGLEIGGPSSIFNDDGILPIYSVVKRLDGCNFSENTVWEGHIQSGETYRYHCGRKNGHQFICDAVNLKMIQDESYDFVLASHVIEHIANPIKALLEWRRVLKEGGVLLLVVPHKDGTFDHNRQATTLQHLIHDFENDVKEDDLTHIEEILQLHDLSMDPAAGTPDEFKKRSMNNFNNRCLHHHVFDTMFAIEILNYCQFKILNLKTILPFHIIILGEKTKLQRKETVDNSLFLAMNAKWRKYSPFASDRECRLFKPKSY